MGVLRWAKYTLAEWNECVLRPVAKEPLWHELVGLFPISCYETSSKPVTRDKKPPAYDCNASQEREGRLASLMGQGRLSLHH
jgi:hypothetical protein